MGKRRRQTAAFKAEAVARLDASGKTLTAVAAELGVPVNQLRNWRHEILAAGSAGALAQQKADAAELQRLRRENKRLAEEVGDPQAGRSFFRGRGSEMRYAFVAAERASHAVAMLCRVIGASVGGFQAWLGSAAARENRARERAALLDDIRRVFERSHRRYGSRRVHAALRAEGIPSGRHRVERLMRESGIAARRGKRRLPVTTDSRHDHPVAPNLLEQDFMASEPDAVWLADISYIPTGEGWLYLAAIKDMATREIVGWSMDGHLRAELCEQALLMALQRRQPHTGLIHHSDRGVRQASRDYRILLARHGSTQSMSRKGNCLDNAPMESFFASLKTELVHGARFATRREARAALFEYMEVFDNRQRLHSGIGYRTPAQAYDQMQAAA